MPHIKVVTADIGHKSPSCANKMDITTDFPQTSTKCVQLQQALEMASKSECAANTSLLETGEYDGELQSQQWYKFQLITRAVVFAAEHIASSVPSGLPRKSGRQRGTKDRVGRVVRTRAEST
jgi:hypothetical protein